MNKEFSSCSSSTIDSLRKAGIGLRGGIKVRGGKLPSSSVQNALMKKKSVAPKIPIKREKVKKEEREPASLTYIKNERDFQDYKRGKGRGRGRAAKVYIQTEGTLLGEGPAQILKRERERERINIPRYSKSSGLKSEDGKVNPKDIDYLLECYDDAISESDSDDDLKPIKYPILNQDKVKIKKETIDQDGVKKFIKLEPPDEELHQKSIVKSEKEDFKVNIKTENLGKNLMEDLKKLEGEDCLMFLLQFPSSLPFQLSSEGPEKANKKKTAIPDSKSKLEEEKQNKDSEKALRLCDLPEGFLGKFQILKSGKMRLVMGSSYLYLEKGIDKRFRSEVVSISLEKKEGDLIKLGNIEQKLILRPHFNGITN